MKRLFNFWQVVRIQGMLLLAEAFFMLLTLLIALMFNSRHISALLNSAFITAVVGILCLLFGRKSDNHIGTRESYLIITISWIVFSVFGMLPFLFSGVIDNVTDAYFETISGVTTTGVSVLQHLDSMPKAILLWRSLIQWLGGMGIIVLYLAFLPTLGVGIKPFFAELPGTSVLRLQPRIKSTTRLLWGIYVLLTIIAIFALDLAGMTTFDALCHALTMMASGGFSTHDANVAYWNIPAVHYIMIFFMIIAGTNIALIYIAFKKRMFKQVFTDSEFIMYGNMIIGATIIICVSRLIGNNDLNVGEIEEVIRTSLFQTVSAITTTGFSATDYTHWASLTHVLLLFLIIVGSCTNSTSGGIKTIRFMVIVQNAYCQIKRLIHPKAIIPVRINKHVIHEHTINSIVALVTIFVGIFTVSTFLFTCLGIDLKYAAEASLASLCNVRFSAGETLQPLLHFPDIAKWFMTFLMLLGRMEFFALLMLFAPAFWKN